MEGYLWKKGRKVPTMKRHYAVLKGTMLAFYTHKDEAQRSGAPPKRVVEIVDSRIMPVTSSSENGHFVLKYLDSEGGGSLPCRADSRESQQLWMEAFQHALKEPDRLAQEEIAEVQDELAQDAQLHSRAVQQATEAVEAAGRKHREQAQSEADLHQNRQAAVELNTQLETARSLQTEALQKLQALRQGLEDARHRVHDSSMGSEDSASYEQAMEAVERLAAKVEVASSAEASHGQYIEMLQQQVEENSREQQQLALRVQQCAEESRVLRQAAAKSLEDAQRAKQRSRRLATWGEKTDTGEIGSNRPSQLDPLVEGYLLCQHPLRSTMHRRYYVLTGNTLSWYMDQDAFVTKMDAPSGVLHVAEVSEWDGRVKATSPLRRLVTPSFGSSSPKASTSGEPYPHAFAVLTVEGKTLRCSAPLKKNQEDWIAALHVGLTMPPLSPHRARAAKARRDSFDLLASPLPSPRKPEGKESIPSTSHEAEKDRANMKQSANDAATSESASLANEVVVKGYLVGKSSMDAAMKKMFCVLRGLTLHIFDSHHDAASPLAEGSRSYHISGVSHWDGHAPLMHYDHGFLLQTQEHQGIYCSAPNLREKNCWVNGVQQELLSRQSDTTRPTNDETLPTTSEEVEMQIQPPSQTSYGAARSEFLSVLQKYYAEHHPGKLGDAPMLLSRYQGREQALIEHLDRLYGTALARDSNVQDLLTALESVPSAPSPTVSLSTQSSYTVPASRASGDISDWLTWNNDANSSFSVLSRTRLERFESEEHSKSGVPLTVFTVAGVHDYPAPSPTMNRSTTASQHQQFFLSGAYDVSKHGQGSSTELLVLQTTTAEAKLRWMAKLRSGLTATTAKNVVTEVKPETATPKAGALPAPQTKTPAMPSSKRTANVFREKLLEFYEQHNPKRVGDVDSLLTSFTGRERQLLAALDATYGTNISGDGSFEDVLPALSPSRALPGGQAGLIHREGYLSVKHPRIGPSFRKCFCVLDGTAWQCFDSSVVAHSGHAPLLSDAVVSLQPVTAKLAETLAFNLELQTNGVIMLHSDAAEVVHDWIHALRAAVATLPEKDEGEDDTKEKQAPDSSFQQLRALLVTFYENHNPAKASDVDTLLRSFQGREGALLEQIDTVYRSHLATDPVCTSLCADLAAKYAEELANAPASEESTGAPLAESILMEGYLMKRGHRIPSMRKRYCVLISNELSYYVTHDDSKNPGGGATTARLGNLLVEIVGDWHGKTNARTYEHGMELETPDGKTFFCAASTAQEKQQWVDAFHRGIAIARNQQRQADIENSRGEEGEESAESEHERRLLEQFREKLAEFYRVRNPAKLPDLDLLLSCYTQRELALLQAIDEAYGTSLARDESILTLLPPLPEQATALTTLKLDGYLKKTAGENSSSVWKRAQTVYVVVDSLTLSLFASREGFKSGGAGLGSMTVLAVKDDDSRHPAANRFAVETSDHEWLRFEARDIMEKRLWTQVLRAALDTVLAHSLLADELRTDRGTNAAGVTVDANGFLLLRLDFDCSQEEHWKRREAATSIEEHSVALENGNEFVISKPSSSEKQRREQTRFHVVSTRAWVPSARCWPVTASNRAPRFPFQIVTQEQFVLSCSAATDVERAKWIRQLRVGAEQAAALEMLEEQLLETKSPLSPSRRSLVDKRERGINDDGKPLSSSSIVVRAPQEEEEPPMTGYLSFRLAQSPHSAGEARLAIQMPIPYEGFVVLTMRAQVAIYDDEDSYYRRDTPNCTGQAVELLSEGVASLTASTHSPKTKSRLRHLFPGTQEAVPSSLAFAILLRPLQDETAVTEGLKDPAMIEFFPTLLSQRDLWMEAFSSRVDFARGEALLADEKIMMRLERDDEDAVDEAHVDKENESSGDNEASDDDDNDKSRESGTEEKFLPPLVMELPSETPRENEDDYMAHSFAFRAAAMEGILIPWQTSTSPIRLPGSSKMKPMAEVYAVLIGHRLCCYGSKESAAAASAATSVRNLTYADDVSPSLDVEVTSCSSWDAPTATWLPINKEKEGLGLKIEVKSSRHGVCFTAPTLEMKLQWLHVLKHELDFVRAERSMSVAELQFTREVAEHLAATAAKAEANQDASAPASSTETKTEGYLRVRHHNLGSVWRDRFVVLDGSKLSIYSNESDAGVDQESDESTPSTALEKHEVVGVEKWHPVFTSKGRSGTGSLKGTGFRIMTSSSIYLECTAISEDEASRWRVAISAATTKEFSDSITTRDSTLPFIPGARMEGYIKLKDPATSKKTVKMKAVKQWKTRYCVVMGSHWLVYANQAQAISSGEAPTPVAVYELVSVTPVEGDDDDSATKFHLHVIPDKRVKCRASSSLERKRWMNAVEDELQTEAKTSEDLARSVKEREEKQAARNAVKTKMHEMKSDARRLSELLGQALQSAQDDSDYESDSDEGILDDAEGGGKQVLQRSRSDYLDGSPESSPMRRRESAFPFDTLDVTKSSKERDTLQPSALGGCFACFFRCIPIRASHGRSTVAPLGIPGYPSTAAACNPQYTCDYYEDDGYRGLTD